MTAMGVLAFEPNSQIKQDVIALGEYLQNPHFRIAVFAPFNYGKSTLLNAWLGARLLPMDLIPTTGAAIHVKYGEQIETHITLKDGTKIVKNGTNILQEYAILDNDRRMRSDVTAVEVYYPDPWLKTGVELIDLPGTDDREAQDNLVRDRLLTADLIIQVLDARKLMTLNERENLRDWLSDRGIKTVVFAINFLNLIPSEEQQEVNRRMRFVAESFRSELPNNVSNLYRVDALPALRAKLKGDSAALATNGLTTFVSAIEQITAIQQSEKSLRLPRLLAVVEPIKQALASKITTITTELTEAKEQYQAEIEVKQKAEKIIKQAFQRSLSELESWLYLPNLLSAYQSQLATALEQSKLDDWENQQLQPKLLEYQNAIAHWVNKASEFFDKKPPAELSITLPKPPEIPLPKSPNTPNKSSDVDLTPVAIATGLGWLLGGPVGAAIIGGATYLIDKNSESPVKPIVTDPELIKKAASEAAKNYLTTFSNEAFPPLKEYQQIVEKWLDFQPSLEPQNTSERYHNLQLLTTLSSNLERELEILSPKIS
ncbi:dynamin [Merismopedia glauca CCAP 1448/3]|uniref:Dynamin n=2 Tax=Merismopedia TaxID=53402 RepID=A0A2T1C3F6_9CYAN|nr:dynamin [Merismopedia glauca CCAP 1448/3]